MLSTRIAGGGVGVVVVLVVILRKKGRWKFKQNEKFNKRETKEKSSNNIFLKDQRKCLCICEWKAFKKKVTQQGCG